MSNYMDYTWSGNRCKASSHKDMYQRNKNRLKYLINEIDYCYRVIEAKQGSIIALRAEKIFIEGQIVRQERELDKEYGPVASASEV